METPEEFVARDDVRFDLDGEYRKVDADTIAARDNAVRLALLDEIGWMRGTWESRLIAMRDKYTPPRGKL
jgi:hypothetical protein